MQNYVYTENSNKILFCDYLAILKYNLDIEKHYALKKEENTSLTNSNLFMIITLREEPNQINVIWQPKLPAAKLSPVCTVYKQWLATSGCNCMDTIPYFSHRSYCF